MCLAGVLGLRVPSLHPGQRGPGLPRTAPGQAVELAGLLGAAGGTFQEGQQLPVSESTQGKAGAAGVRRSVGGADGPGLQEGGQVLCALLGQLFHVILTAAPAKSPKLPSCPGATLLFQLLQPLQPPQLLHSPVVVVLNCFVEFDTEVSKDLKALVQFHGFLVFAEEIYKGVGLVLELLLPVL